MRRSVPNGAVIRCLDAAGDFSPPWLCPKALRRAQWERTLLSDLEGGGPWAHTRSVCPVPSTSALGNVLGRPSSRVQGGKGPSGEVPGAGAGPPAVLPPAARTRSPVRSLAEPAWQEALLIAAEGPSRLPSSLSRPCAAPEGLLPGPRAAGAGSSPTCSRAHPGARGNAALLLQPPVCTSTGVTAPRTRGRPSCRSRTVPPRGPSAPGHCLREGGRVGRRRAMRHVPGGARSRVWE